MPTNKRAQQFESPESHPLLTEREEYGRRVEAARRWAGAYAALGWPVTPSCAGDHVRAASCGIPDLHPANPRWREEATSDPAALDELWQRRRAYGVIGRTGEAMAALHITHVAWSKALAALAGARVMVPLARLLRPTEQGGTLETLYAVVQPVQAAVEAELALDARLRLHDACRPLPLPAADAGGRVIWAAAPALDKGLPAVGEVVAAFAPLLVI